MACADSKRRNYITKKTAATTRTGFPRQVLPELRASRRAPRNALTASHRTKASATWPGELFLPYAAELARRARAQARAGCR